jgi:CHASE2 domain-containing sensor protein
MPATWRRRLLPGLPALLGVAFYGVAAWEELSFDALFLSRLGRPAPPADPQSAASLILKIDARTKQAAGGSEMQPLNRTNHAVLLHRLRQDGARLVVFDLQFEEVQPEQDAEFAAAIAQHGNVLLASVCGEDTTGPARVFSLKPLSPLLRPASAGVGNIGFYNPQPADQSRLDRRKQIWRQPPEHQDGCTSLPALVAHFSGGGGSGFDPSRRLWLNYYGPANTLPGLSYADALWQEPGFFKGKVVWVGDVTPGGDDLRRTPLSRWGGGDMPGTEILLTATLNLLRGDTLRRWPAAVELPLVLGVGGVLGWGALRWRRRWFVLGAALGMLLGPAAAIGFAHLTGLWCNWAVVSLVQLPAAIVLNLMVRYKPHPQISDETPPAVDAVVIPGHCLHGVIGRGGFGEVWLAQNELLGTFRAVKVVRRARTGDTRHFDYELRGVKLYEPISRAHPGLLAILQVGLAPSGDYFYYVMELADAEAAGQPLQPATYAPRTLAAAGAAPLRLIAAIDVGIALADALAFLHSHKVVHRDLKPANIVYVGGQPKLGDPGLAAEADRSQPSQPGTLEYMDPETHGQPAGDLFSLGKVLARAAGVAVAAPAAAPVDLPSAVAALPVSSPAGPRGDADAAKRFAELLAQAGAPEARRFSSAAEFRDALRALRATL